ETTEGEPGARSAIAGGTDRLLNLIEPSVAQIELALGGQNSASATEAGRQYTVEKVDATSNPLDQVRRVADSHQVARPIGRQIVDGCAERRPGLLALLADAQSADAIAIERHLSQRGGRLRP